MSTPGREARDAFLETYRQDLEEGQLRNLSQYQALFPGHEGEIAEDYAWLEPSYATAAATDTDEMIGPYRILSELGRGAQAVVYLAEHETLHRQVALKALRAPVLGTATSAQKLRFNREAEVTARLDHPGICSVFEVGLSDGIAWIAMQYISGQTLAKYVAAKRLGDRTANPVTLPVAPASNADSDSSRPHSSPTGRDEVMRVVLLVERVARALHVAHEHGLVHRDIKPGNIMVADDGRPVLLDFGLAHKEHPEGLALTQTGDLLGTPYYMAPEQLRKESTPLDRRTDVYALGVTLYECLTLQRPFGGGSREALFREIMTVEAPLARSVNPQLSRDLEVVLQTSLNKERGSRYQTALDLAEDLRRVRGYEPINARPVTLLGRVWRWAQRHPGVAVSIAIVLLSLTTSLIVVSTALQRVTSERNAKEAARASLQSSHEETYEMLSMTAAHWNSLGWAMPFEPSFKKHGRDILALYAPGLGESYKEYLIAKGNIESSRQLGELLLNSRPSLSGVARTCAADLLEQCGHSLERNSLERQGLARNRAELSLAIRFLVAADELRSKDLVDVDPRKIRTRILLLDLYERLEDFDTAAELAVRSTKEVSDYEVLKALFQTRLGAALLGLGRLDEALATLEANIPTLTGEGSYYGAQHQYVYRANAALTETLQALGRDVEARQARHLLAHALARTKSYVEPLEQMLRALEPDSDLGDALLGLPTLKSYAAPTLGGKGGDLSPDQAEKFNRDSQAAFERVRAACVELETTRSHRPGAAGNGPQCQSCGEHHDVRKQIVARFLLLLSRNLSGAAWRLSSESSPGLLELALKVSHEALALQEGAGITNREEYAFNLFDCAMLMDGRLQETANLLREVLTYCEPAPRGAPLFKCVVEFSLANHIIRGIVPLDPEPLRNGPLLSESERLEHRDLLIEAEQLASGALRDITLMYDATESNAAMARDTLALVYIVQGAAKKIEDLLEPLNWQHRLPIILHLVNWRYSYPDSVRLGLPYARQAVADSKRDSVAALYVLAGALKESGQREEALDVVQEALELLDSSDRVDWWSNEQLSERLKRVLLELTE